MMDTKDAQRELEEFIRQWRQEVGNRKQQQLERQKNTRIFLTPQQEGKQTTSTTKINDDQVPLTEEMKSMSSENEKEEKQEPKTAIDYYIIAVDNERQGKLGQALAAYRHAFKIDPDVDYHYKRHYQKHIAPTFSSSNISMPLSTTSTTTTIATVTAQPNEVTQEFRHTVPVGNEYITPSATRKDPLEDLIETFTNESITYLPIVDYKPVHIARIPSELLLHVLQHLVLRSISSISEFALVCKNFFLLTRAPSLWRFASEHTFKTPYMTIETSRDYQADYVEKVYNGHWMRMFIERPRIRYDGIYISTCHYMRPGSNESPFNQPIHSVIYYRYLRFFPDGTIIKYLSTEEPEHVVRLLTPEFNRRQVFKGYFEQNEGRLYVEMKDILRPRESFRMVLNIKSTHRGRHNKLSWVEYVSETEGREDETHYDLKMMKSYFFSPVRSYIVDHPAEPPSLEGPLTRRNTSLPSNAVVADAQ